MATAVLCTAVLLVCAGLSIAAPSDTAPQTVSKRQRPDDTGECTVSQYRNIVRNLDPSCLDNAARFDELSLEIALGSDRPSPEIVEELRSLSMDVCGDGCGLIGYRIGRECFPDDESQAHEDTVASCSSNGRFMCGLSLVEAQNRSVVRQAQRCLFQFEEEPDRCPPGCRGALRRLSRDIDCCAYSYLHLLTLVSFNDSSVTENLFDSCRLPSPMPCPDPFANITTPTRPPLCFRGEYECAGGQCIPDSYVCDGEEDCFSGDDEHDCPTTTVATDGGTDTPFVIGSGISGSGSGSGSVSNCSAEMLLDILSKYTPECSTASVILSELLDILLNTTTPDSYLIRQTFEVARNVCSRGCAGVTYELLTNCYPDGSEDTVQYLIDFCSADEARVCGLAYLTVSDSENFNNVLGCVLQHRRGRCPRGCSDVLNAFVDDISCCANHYLRLTFPKENTTDLYQACEVADPGFCRNPFEDRDVCRPREFLCRKDRTCISRRRLCDGVEDCSDGSDEKLRRCPTVIPPFEPDIYVGMFPPEIVVSEARPRARLHYCVEVFSGEIDERIMVEVESFTDEEGFAAERGRDYRNFTDRFALTPGGENEYSPRGNPLYCRFHNLAIIPDRKVEKTELEYFFLDVHGGYRVATVDGHENTLVYIADDDIAQIGFEQPSYRVNENNGSVEVCVRLLRGELGYPINFRVAIVDGTAEEDYDFNATDILPALGYISHVRPPRRRPRPTTEPPSNETRTPPTDRTGGTRTPPTEPPSNETRTPPTDRTGGTRTPPTGTPEPTRRPPMRPDGPRPGTWCVDLPIIDDTEEEEEESIVLEVFTGDVQLFTGRRRRTEVIIVDDDAPQPLEVFLTGDTPRASVGTVEVTVATNKRATAECRLSRRNFRRTMDCRPGTTTTFTGLQSGTYTLRVTATADDESDVYITGVAVPTSDSECTVNLINYGVDINGANATVEFVGVGPVEGFVCRLNGRTYPCTSPQQLSALSPGRNRLRVTPVGCQESETKFQTFFVDIPA